MGDLRIPVQDIFFGGVGGAPFSKSVVLCLPGCYARCLQVRRLD